MKRLFPLLLTLLLFPLPGCGLGNGIPRGLDWQALTVTDQRGPLRRHYRLPPVLPRRRGRLGGVWYHRAHRWQPGGRPLSHCRGCDGLLYRPTF